MHLSLLLLKSQRIKKKIKINKNIQTNIEERCKEQYQEIRKAEEGMEPTQEFSESCLLNLQQINLKEKRVYSQNFRVSGDTQQVTLEVTIKEGQVAENQKIYGNAIDLTFLCVGYRGSEKLSHIGKEQ